uniref:CSON004674 protein n=1 Tax=Culicoides sonorensis TaxID=179676 RepID=A0A336LU29_CULSO
MSSSLLEPESPSGDLSWTKLLDGSASPGSIIVKIDDQQPVKETAQIPDPELNNRRRESILGTFHRQLRMSLKAVSESPGPLTR